MTTDSSVFDFAAAVADDAEAFHPGIVDVLPKGNYILTITDVENTTSSGGFPLLKLTLENELGRQWDNLVISPNEFSVAKLNGLIDAAKLKRPAVGNGLDMDPIDGRLADAYVMALRDRKVGVIVRDEEDNRPDHVGESRPRVKGYVHPDILTTATTGPLGGPPAAATAPKADDNPLAF